MMPDQSLTANIVAPPQQHQLSTTGIPEIVGNNSNKAESATGDKVTTNNGQIVPAAAAVAEKITPPADQAGIKPTIKEETNLTTSPTSSGTVQSRVEVLDSPLKSNTADSSQNQQTTNTSTSTTTKAKDRFIDTTSPLPEPVPTQEPSVGTPQKESPIRNFLQRADKFVERNLKKLLRTE